MDNFDKQINSFEKQAAGSGEPLQYIPDESLKLMNAAIADLAEGNDCKYCANIDQCTPHQVERNIVYKGCNRWLWRGVKLLDKAADVSSRKQ